MASQNSKKRSFPNIDLTGDSDDDFAVPSRKQVKSSATGQASRPSSNLPPSSGSSSVGYGLYGNGNGNISARSQASQFRYDEDGGNELVDEADERFDDLTRYVLYGE
jgi:hypothetical protein